MSEVINYFPEKYVGGPATASQIAAITAIEEAFKQYPIVILEAPVGSGKSAIAMSFAEYYKDTHLLTPRKSLQDQYFDDFEEISVLMKGRAAYPCTYKQPPGVYEEVVSDIKDGRIVFDATMGRTCAQGPCKNANKIKDICTNYGASPCPYHIAVETAQKNPTIIHNIHSFIYQSLFGGYYGIRKLLVLDEAHVIRSVFREFATKSFTIRQALEDSRIPRFETIKEWCTWLSQEDFLPVLSEDREDYLVRVMDFSDNYELSSEFVIHWEASFTYRQTSIKFVPKSLRGLAQNLIFQYGEKVLLMSGTIYDKNFFCSQLGLDVDAVRFLRLDSSFPKENRPIICKPQYQLDTSFKSWKENLPILGEKIREILGIFNDCKGLIHAPSYIAAKEILAAVDDPRLVTHTPENFLVELERFYNSEGTGVFVSPVCQEGVDFKGDRARFQIIVRVPYSNTSDKYTEYLVQENFQEYNYEALVTFGQMIGRVNRREDDYGVTILMDLRFKRFLASNTGKLPKWVKTAIQY